MRRLSTVLGVAAAALVLGSWVPASASPAGGVGSAALPSNPSSDPSLMSYIQTHDTPMGAEIRSHETVTPGVTPYVTQTPGLDVSGYQGNVNWSSVAANGAKFAYIKATESTNYTNPYFTQQYNGSYNVGLIRGSYHFAHPDATSGATQADYFVAHGGGWSADGKTLPGALDIEWNPNGATCYGLSQSAMGNWIASFVNEYHAKEGVYPVIYTANSWWSQCVGTAHTFSSIDPLWVACYCSSAGTMPYNWGFYTFWQYNDTGTFPGDQDYFNGDYSRLQALALG